MRRHATKFALAAAALSLAPAVCRAQAASPAFELPRRAVAPPALVTLSEVRYRGNTVLGKAELDLVAAPFIGRPLDAGELESLRLAVTARYIAAGYINSGALLGTQALEGDVLTVEIVEGRLGQIRVSGMQGLRDGYLVSRLLDAPAAPFNMDALRERYAMVLGDPLFDRLNARVMPGAALGEALLDIEVQRSRPYALSVFINNYRPPSIGAVAAGVKGTVRNLSGWGDVLDATVQAATQGSHSPRTSLGWQFPLTPAVAFTLQWDHGLSSVVEEPLRVLEIESKLDSKEAGISYAVADALRHKLVLGLSVGERRNTTLLGGLPFSFTPGEPDGTTKVRSIRFWQEAVLRSPTQVLALRSTFTATSNNTRLIAGLPPGGPAQAARHAWLWQGQGQYVRPMSETGTQLTVRASLQWSGSTLVALDRMAIGGIGTVRGFRENQLVRERGAVVSVEYEMPLVSKGKEDVNLALLPFIDAGRGVNRGEHGESLASLGVAARLRWSALTLDLALARRLVQPESARHGSNLQDLAVHAQLSYRF